MIKINPDPEHPLGGFAEISINGIDPFDDPIEISVFNSYQEKWLGPDGWQPNRHRFSARYTEWASNTLTLVVGPEIVNSMDEDIPARILINDIKFETYWPDDINHGPDDATIGDIGGSETTERPQRPTVVAVNSREKEQKTNKQPLTPYDNLIPDEEKNKSQNESLEPDNTLIDDTVFDSVKKKNKSLIVVMSIAMLILIAAIAVGIWYFLGMYEQEENPRLPDQAKTRLSECRQESLDKLANQGFSALSERFKTCGQSVSADNALRLLERATSENDPDALLTFGILYDQNASDEVLEKQIGLTFSDQPSLSAEYYTRALNAGSADAQTYLTGVCRRLRLMDDTLSRSAVEDYCSEN
ncbi:MAG: hypothetical protein OXC62_06180 [Aestuariivita sp.]|nr:hypothetical protein [Aestuariivita sp.]